MQAAYELAQACRDRIAAERCAPARMIGPRASTAGRAKAGVVTRCACRGTKSAPVHHAGKEVGLDSGGLDGQRESAHHVVADFVLLGSGSGGADAPGEGGFLLGHARGSLFGPRG